MPDVTFREVVTLRDALNEMRRDERNALSYRERYGQDGSLSTREKHEFRLRRAHELVPVVEQLLVESVAPSPEVLERCTTVLVERTRRNRDDPNQLVIPDAISA